LKNAEIAKQRILQHFST